MKNELKKKLNIHNADQIGKSVRNNFIFIRSASGQSSIIELAAFIVILAVALVAIQSYVTRAMQGRLKESADSIGSQYDPGSTYVDFNTSIKSSTTSTTIVTDLGDLINSTTTVSTNYDNQTRSGVEVVGAY